MELVATAHGTAIVLAIALDDADALAAALARLPAEEQRIASTLSPIRRREFVAGRLALHSALDDFAFAIVPDERGAPTLPAGYTGSVSHKGAHAAAIVAPREGGLVGLDLERAAPPRSDIAPRILTPRELAALPTADERGRAVTLRFAIKEAIYKAIDPVVRRYVGFQEVEVDVAEARACCAVTSAFPLAVEASWLEHAGHWLATARAVPR